MYSLLALSQNVTGKADGTQRANLSQAKNTQRKKIGSIPGFGERFLATFGSLKQSEIATLLNVQPSAITNYTKDRVPKPHILLKVWELTKCDLHWLLTGEHWTTPQNFSSFGNHERELIEQIAQNQHQSFDTVVRILVIESLIARGLMSTKTPPSMLILRQDINLIAINLIGTITIGQPIIYFEEAKKVLVADVLLSQGYQSFALQILNDDLQAEGLSQGDYLICSDDKTPQDGLVAVVLIDGSKTTVKRIYFHGHDVALHPQNGHGQTEFYTVDRIEIVATVTGILRDPNLWPP